jgi:hypothetical protein
MPSGILYKLSGMKKLLLAGLLLSVLFSCKKGGPVSGPLEGGAVIY